MLTVVAIMALGIAVGIALRSKPKLIAISDKLTMWAIFLLLFLLGLAIGANEVIVKNLPLLGLQALAIAIGGVVGSVLLAWVAYRLWFKSKNNRHEG
jgi:uncharacterized membrane protein YbjE (DUF340 family)